MRAQFVKFAGVATALLLLLIYVPTAWAGFSDHGTLGVRFKGHGVAVSVEPGGPAARAGIAAGDAVDLRALPWPDRITVATGRVPASFAVRTSVRHAGAAPRVVTLHAAIAPRPRAIDAWLQTAAFLITAITLVVAAALIVLRPGAMAWWLLLYAAGTIGATELTAMYAWLPPVPRGVFNVVVLALIGVMSAYPILPFVLRFPYDRAEGRRRALYIASVAFTVVAAIGSLAYYLELVADGSVADLSMLNLISTIPIPLAIAVLLSAYFRANERERQRLKWAIFGMSFAFVAYAASSFAYQISESLSNAINLLTVVMPLSLAYAVLRHRLIDFGFALNRAIVYSATTTALVVLVTAIDRLSSWLLSQFHLALAFDALATVGLGFVMGRIHRVLETLVDRVLFRKRSQAERHLRRIAGAMSYAVTPHAVDEMLAAEPAATLELAASAVFRYERSVQRFVRTASTSWTDDEAWYIDADDPLLLLVQNEQAPIGLDDVRWKHPGMPHGPAAPVVAVPIRFRRDVTGVALFSGHRNGTTLDPEEIALLAVLAESAGTAHGLAEAALAQRRIGELEAQLAARSPAAS